jgi:hypothetical protein
MLRFMICFGVCLICSALSQASELADVIRSVKSGNWSAGDTWSGGKVPAAGARVHVLAGHSVTYDVASPEIIRAVNIAGKLSFSREKNTLLNVGLIKIEASESFSEDGFDCTVDLEDKKHQHDASKSTLEVGSQLAPIPNGKTAIIRLHAVEGMDVKSCPAIVCCAGRMDFHGTPMSRTWVKLGATVQQGDTAVTLHEPVTGWQIGDRILITPTDVNGKHEDMTETRVITLIEGNTIRFAEGLERKHLGEAEFRAEVANLSRNVVVESADPAGARGHTMYHHNSAGGISYAEFRHLGKKDTLGRYSLHFHLCGNSMRGSSVVGASIWGSHNRWLTIHGTNYLLVRDCVGYGSIGHGFFLEDGTEVFNVLDRNLAVGAVSGKRLPKQVLPFDHNQGAGFWWTNSLNTFTRNVAASNDLYGFRYEATPGSAFDITKLNIMQPDGTYQLTDPRTLPFVRFEDNEVHSNLGLYGINLGEGVNFVGPDAKHPFVVRNTKIWDVHYGFRPQVPSLLVENMTIDTDYGIYHPNFDNHVYRNLTIRATNTEPFNRGHDDLSTQHGVLTVDGLTFDNIRSGGMPLIQISDENVTGRAESHFRNVKTVNWNDKSKAKALVNLGGGPRPQPKSAKGVPIYLHDYYGAGQTAMVVSMRSPEYKTAPDSFQAEEPLTGNESRVKKVTNVEFPQPLSPVDDLPPATLITRVELQGADRLLVRGVVSDNGEVKKVVVNGRTAELNTTTRDWEITLPAVGKSLELIVSSEDAVGNREKLPHVMNWQR